VTARVSSLLDLVEPKTARILHQSLEGEELSGPDLLTLFEAQGHELHALAMTADELRRRVVGEVVTYVVNRNISFTNVCVKRCDFCAFSRGWREEEGYYLPIEEIVRRTKEAAEFGATEVCVQAGLPPQMDGRLYVDICRAIKKEVPEIHIHGFSPEEVIYGSLRSGCSVAEYLAALKEAGLGSIPGTAAEILVQKIRNSISPGRITVERWIEVVTTAHQLGIPTTSTIMYGHLEKPAHWVQHLLLLRDIQKQTGGFTEFVPLSFIYQETPVGRRSFFTEASLGATADVVIKMHAVARLAFNGYIQHIQASWVKEGPKFAQYLLMAGCDDFGGTLMNEIIAASAGATHGQMMRPIEIRRLIRASGRVPAQRSTLYEIMRVFEDDGPAGALDLVEDPESTFGSYRGLVSSPSFKYEITSQAGRRAATGV